jgi:hypothetical protein
MRRFGSLFFFFFIHASPFLFFGEGVESFFFSFFRRGSGVRVGVGMGSIGMWSGRVGPQVQFQGGSDIISHSDRVRLVARTLGFYNRLAK